MKKIIICLMLILSIFSLNGCNKKEEKVDIVTSCYPIYDFTKRIAGDKLVVKNLVKAGVEPHHYEPTTSDIAMLSDSKMFIINGLNLEHYLTTLPQNINDKLFEATANIEPIYQDNNTVDPHMWLDIQKAIKMMENIKNYIKMIDSENASYYEANFKAHSYLFNSLDNLYKTELSNLTSPYLVTSHAAFNYLCQAYGINALPIQGLSTESEPTAAEITKIMNEVKDKNVTTIFYEELVSDAIAKKIANDTGLKCEVLYPIEGLASDMSSDDYLSLMAKNLDKLVNALK